MLGSFPIVWTASYTSVKVAYLLFAAANPSHNLRRRNDRAYSLRGLRDQLGVEVGLPVQERIILEQGIIDLSFGLLLLMKKQ